MDLSEMCVWRWNRLALIRPISDLYWAVEFCRTAVEVCKTDLVNSRVQHEDCRAAFFSGRTGKAVGSFHLPGGCGEGVSSMVDKTEKSGDRYFPFQLNPHRLFQVLIEKEKLRAEREIQPPPTTNCIFCWKVGECGENRPTEHLFINWSNCEGHTCWGALSGWGNQGVWGVSVPLELTPRFWGIYSLILLLVVILHDFVLNLTCSLRWVNLIYFVFILCGQ